MSAPIDPSSISTWEDAFQHPIPQVRQLERQLRADLAGNKEKLRGLVGESYRDLLQTAERIIDMDVAAQNVEAHLGDASRNCNSRLLERKAKNLRLFNDIADKRDREKYTFAAQLAVLEACPTVISWLLHKDEGASCLLASKVFVISRLLLKSLSEKNSLPLLATLRSQCGTLRPILLQHIDTLLSSSAPLATRVLVSTLAAFSIIKTSSPSEVLRHFLYIRSTALSSLQRSTEPNTILISIALFNRTLHDTEEIFPGKLSDALVALKSKSLLQDAEVTAVPELSLDINARWLPDDIRSFTPWVRHDDLEKVRVKELVQAWAEKEIVKLNENLQKTLEAMNDVADIVKLRSGALALWRAGAQIRRKLLSGGCGENFRTILMNRVVEVMKSVAEELRHVAEKIHALLPKAEYESDDSTSLWPETPLSIDLTNGALSFRTSISNRVHGRSPVVLSFLSVYTSWLSRISAIATIARDLRSSSYPSTEEDEDFESEEERSQAGIEDSFLSEKELTSALDGVYRLLERSLKSTFELTPIPITRRQTVFLLRAIRQIRQLPPKRQGEDANANAIISLSWFGAELIPRLHGSIAEAVTTPPIRAVTTLLQRRKWEAPVISRPLWEAYEHQPDMEPLPVQPSPLVFRFLNEIVKEMRLAGEDVWTPAAVKTVKARACNHMWGAMEEVLRDREWKNSTDDTPPPPPPPSPPSLPPVAPSSPPPPPADDGEEEEVAPPAAEPTPAPTPKPYVTRDWALQLLFDTLYLDEALHRKRRRGSTNGSSVTSLVGKIDSVMGGKVELDEELRIRLEGAASEYWKRTCLLFALLS